MTYKRKLLRYKEGGELDDPDPLNPFNKPIPIKQSTFFRPIVFLPQARKLTINDKRKTSSTSNKPINPDKEVLSGKYDTDRIDNIVHYAKQYGIDPYNLLAMDLQETSLGKTRKDAHKGYVTPPGHVLMDEADLAPSRNTLVTDLQSSKIDFDSYNTSNGYDIFARAYKAKELDAANQGLKKEVDILQNYNGRGIVVPSTEQSYNGFKMKQIYGVNIPSSGINMKSNPLYGKRILDLRDNVLKNSPQIRDAVENTYANGGEIMRYKRYDSGGYFQANRGYATPEDDYYGSQFQAQPTAVIKPTGNGLAGIQPQLNAGIGATNFAGDFINNIAGDSNFGNIAGGALKGAASGAAAGSIVPGVGTIIGGAVGLVGGLIGGIGRNKQKELAKRQQIEAKDKQRVMMQQNHDKEVLSQYNTNGNYEQGYYGNGGTINTGFLRRQSNKGVYKGYRSMVNPHFYPKMDEGGELPIDDQPPVKKLRQVNIIGKRPLIVYDKNDPRLRAYNDSTLLHTLIPHPRDKDGKMVGYTDKIYNAERDLWNKAEQDLGSMHKIDRYIGTPESMKNTWGFGPYKAPQQEVIYKKPQPTIVNKPIGRKPVIKLPEVAITPSSPKNPSDTYDPSLLINGRFMVNKDPNSDVQSPWGNPIEDEVVNKKKPLVPVVPVILPSDKAAGYSNTFYPARGQQQGRSVPTQYRSGYKYGGVLKYAEGGTVPLASDVHKFVGPDHEDGGIPIDTTGNGQPNAEVEGDEVQKGNQIFSDRLKPSQELINILKQNKIKVSGTYADVATKLGKMKGRYESKMLTHSPIALRTGQAMLGRVDNMMQMVFQDQEMSKPQIPQFAFGGTLPTYAEGGNLDDPKDPRKIKAAELQRQLDAFDAAYAKAKADLAQKNLSIQQKAQYENRLKTIQSYRKSIETGINMYGKRYNDAASKLPNVMRQYQSSSAIGRFIRNDETPQHANDVAQGYSKRVDEGMEMLKRLDPTKLDLSNDNYLDKAGIKANRSEGTGGAEYRSWGDDYYPTKLNGDYTPVNNNGSSNAPVNTTPTIPVSHTPPLVANTPIAKVGARHTQPYTGRKATPIRGGYIDPGTSPGTTIPNSTPSALTAPSLVAAGTGSIPIDKPSLLDNASGLINKYGADVLNVASYFGNKSAINSMKAPTFNLVPAPNYSYRDRSALAKYDNSTAVQAAQAGVINISAQGNSAEKAAIFAQGLNGVNQINQQENLRKDNYDANYENRVLQNNYTNTDIINRQSDVNTQVNNEKVAMGIQNRNTLAAGEISNQNTRNQEELDTEKALTILAGTQDPDKALGLISSFMGPERAKRLHQMYYRR